MFINDYYWERLEGGVHMRICDSLLATAQARLNRQRRSTSQDWLDGLKTALWRLQISKFFWGGMPPDPLVGVAYGHTSFGLTSINLAIAPLQTEHFVQNYLCAQSELAEFLAYLCSCILVQTNKLIKYSQP